MILTCPECSTRYQADAARFPPGGRDVRCAKCGHVWHQSGPEADSEPVIAAPEPAPSAYEAPPRPQAYRQTPSFAVASQERAPRPRSPWLRRILLGVGWAALIAILGLVFWTATVYRQQIVSTWPQSASFYSTLGFKINASGLKFDNVEYHQVPENGQPMLVVTGKLTNIGDRTLSVPQIRVTLSDDDNRELYHWTFVPAVISLRPGQTTLFVTRLSSPPAAARHLDLRFARAGE
jgi:predicted Zn finger-like uncharacterized protein